MMPNSSINNDISRNNVLLFEGIMLFIPKSKVRWLTNQLMSIYKQSYSHENDFSLLHVVIFGVIIKHLIYFVKEICKL